MCRRPLPEGPGVPLADAKSAGRRFWRNSGRLFRAVIFKGNFRFNVQEGREPKYSESIGFGLTVDSFTGIRRMDQFNRFAVDSRGARRPTCEP
jgi:hypothetical protein